MLTRKYISISLAILLVLASLAYTISFRAVAYPDSIFSSKRFALNFLENVTGFKNYKVVSFKASTSRTPDPDLHYQTDLRMVISVNNSNFESLITLIDNKFCRYDLDLPSDLPDGGKTLGDCLVVAYRTVERYRELFNADYCDGFAEMISTALQNQGLLVENENALLKISYAENVSTPMDYKRYVNLQWLKKIKSQFVTPMLSIGMSVSKNGLTTMLVDNLAIDYVATTDINVSREGAINIAVPYAEAYAKEHGQKIASVNATLTWIRDLNACRGDSYAIYPVWGVLIRFDKINESVYGYSVGIWADNGEVFDHDPQGLFLSTGNGENMYMLPLILTIIASILVFSGFNLYRKRKIRTKARRQQR